MLDNPLPAGGWTVSLSLICSYVIHCFTKDFKSSNETNLETPIEAIVINTYGD